MAGDPTTGPHQNQPPESSPSSSSTSGTLFSNRVNVALLLVIGLAILHPLWTGSGIIYSKHSDIIAQYVGIKSVGQQAITNERTWPFWNPSMNAGAPAFANPESMSLFPFDLLYLVLPIGIATNL